MTQVLSFGCRLNTAEAAVLAGLVKAIGTTDGLLECA